MPFGSIAGVATLIVWVAIITAALASKNTAPIISSLTGGFAQSIKAAKN